MAIEMTSDRAICSRCGTAYGRRKGNFPVSYAALYKGTGYLHVCKTCVDTMYNNYLAQSNDPRSAVRQVCRKLDLFWSDALYEATVKKNTPRTMMTSYIQKSNSINYAGLCYDDTLANEGGLWLFHGDDSDTTEIEDASVDDVKEITMEDISEDVLTRWGPGYTPEMYVDLEQRRTYWINNLPDDITPDIGMETLIRQICCLEIDINMARASGKSADKLVLALEKLIGSMNLKPGQRSDDNAAFDKTPFGVWIDRWEYHRPVPEPDPDLGDFDNIVKKISTWFLGHICAMFGFKNKYCKLYEDKIASMRIERNEAEDDDDEEAFNVFFGGGEDG